MTRIVLVLCMRNKFAQERFALSSLSAKLYNPVQVRGRALLVVSVKVVTRGFEPRREGAIPSRPVPGGAISSHARLWTER